MAVGFVLTILSLNVLTHLLLVNTWDTVALTVMVIAVVLIVTVIETLTATETATPIAGIGTGILMEETAGTGGTAEARLLVGTRPTIVVVAAILVARRGEAALPEGTTMYHSWSHAGKKKQYRL